MATKIVTKNSSTASAVPTASDLVQGELAVNVADKRLFTEDNGGSIVELGTNPSTLTVTGEITANGGIALGDNDKATFGSGDDLQIYHDGSNSYVKDAGAGYLNLLGTGRVVVGHPSNGDVYLNANYGGDVELFFSNSKKFETTSTGIDVTGTATMDGLTVDGGGGSGPINFNSNGGARASLDYNNGTGLVTLDNLYGSIIAKTGTGGSSAERMRIDSSGNVGIGTSSPDAATTIVSANVATGSNGTLGVKANAAAINNGGQITLGTTSARHVAIAGRQEASGGSAGYLQLSTRGSSGDITERMRIDSTGKVGIGTTSPNKKLVVNENGSECVAIIKSSDTGTAGLFLGGQTDEIKGGIVFNNSDNSLQLRGYNNTERMRIGSSGTVSTTGSIGVGRTSVSAATEDAGIVLSSAGYIYSAREGTSNQSHIVFINNAAVTATTVGTIRTSGSATSYNTSSDYRLKTDAQPMTGATARLKALKPVNFEWISDGTRVDGFLAHEAQAVVPECVSGEKDAMQEDEYEVTPAVLDEEGNTVEEAVMGTRSVPDYQGIDQSKLVPLLVATIQELEARITQLENN